MKKLLFFIILFPHLVLTSDWTGTSGNWSDAGNWSAGVPNAADAVATFPLFLSGGGRTITLDISPTVGTLSTNAGPYAYTFTPSTSTIHFDGAAPTFTVSANPGTFNCLFSLDSSTTFSPSSLISISRGISGPGDLTKSGSGQLLISAACSYTGATNLSAGTLFLVTSNGLPTSTDLTITGGTCTLNNVNQTVGSLAGTGGAISFSSAPGFPVTLTTGSSNTDTAYSGTITGSGQITKVGTGILTLSGANAYSAGTNIHDGTISISADNNLGTGDIEINTATLKTTASFSTGKGITLNGTGTLSVNPGITTTCTGDITGGGGLIKSGTGTLVLSYANTYTGETNISAGTLRAGIANAIASDSSVEVTGTFDLNNFDQSIAHLGGSGNVTLGTATLTIGSSSLNSIFTGVISETGGILKVGTGEEIFAGVNTYTGSTNVSTGTLQMGIANALSTSTAVTADGTFDLDSHDQDIGSLAGSGSVTLGSGTLSLGNDNTDTTFSGIISDTGNLTKVGSGIFTISGVNTYTGTTTISAGTLKTGVASALSSSTAVTDNSILNLNNYNQDIGSLTGSGSVTLGSATLSLGNDNTSTTFSGIISGTGALSKVGTGTFTISGANSYTGATTISAGTLKAGAASVLSSSTAVTATGTFNLNDLNQNIGSLAGAGSVTLGSAALTLGNDNTNTTFSGSISGTGALTKVGTGTLTLSGANTYTGATTINAGTIVVHGNTTSPVTVGSSARLGGNGTITGNVTAEGTIQPGASIGTLHVTGDVTFSTGSTYEVEVSPTASDLLDVTGSVTIQSGVNFELIPDIGMGSYQAFQQYTIIQTGTGVSGTFDNVITSYPCFFGELSYDDPNTVVLVVNVVPFASLIKGGNPGEVAAYIDTLTPLQEGSDLDNVIETIQRLDLAGMRSAFDQMHCAPYKGLALSQENNLTRIRSLISQRTDDLYRASCIRDVSDTKKITFWGAPFFDYYNQHNVGELIGFHTKTAGIIVGADRQVITNNYLGIAGSYTFSNIDWEHDRGKADIDSFYASLYYTWLNKLFYFNSSIFGAFNHFEAHRNISFSNIDRSASTQHRGKEFGLHADGGSTLYFSWMDLRPFASVDGYFLREDNFTETGANSLNLNVKQVEYWMLRTELGSHFAKCFFDTRKWVGDVKLSWVREMRFKGKHYYCQLVDQPNHFRVSGINSTRNIFSPGLSLSAIFPENQGQFAVRYDGEFAKHYVNHIISLQMLFNF